MNPAALNESKISQSLSCGRSKTKQANVKIVQSVVSAIVTVALFLLMAFLITPKGEPPTQPESEVAVKISRDKRVEDSRQKNRKKTKKPKQEQMPPPPVIPRDRPIIRSNNSAMSVPLPPVSDGKAALAGEMDRRATPIVRFPPEYPQGPLSRNIEGWVLVEFTITQAGSVDEMRVVDADPQGVFDRAALRAIKRWKYQPKIVNGKAVPQYNMRDVFRFEIEK